MIQLTARESIAPHVFFLQIRSENTARGGDIADGKIEWNSVGLRGGNYRGPLGRNGRTTQIDYIRRYGLDIS